MHKFSKVIAGLSIFALSLATVPTAFAATATDTVNLQANVVDTLTLDCGGSTTDPDVDFGTVTAGTPAVGTSACTVVTNSENGYDLFVDRTTNADTSVLKHEVDGLTYIADLTAWDGADGDAWTNGTTVGLGLRVQSITGSAGAGTIKDTMWGTSTSCTSAADAGALYAGVPQDPDTSTPYPIMDEDVYSGTSTTTTICYKLDVPPSQKSGVYSGDITYTAITKP